MDLSDYLHALKTCPADQLTDELGIYDNYSILLRVEPPSLLADVASLGWSPRGGTTTSPVNLFLEHLSLPLGMRVMDPPSQISFTNLGFFHNPSLDPHTERQQRDYTLSITLLIPPRTGVNFKEVIPIISLAVQDLGRLIVAKRIPACFPYSHGAKHEADYSRIVYFEPIDYSSISRP